ncbi:MAG: hypothetical protein ACLSWI_03645 [Candidatus Gastranaerophilaceae bacterium]
MQFFKKEKIGKKRIITICGLKFEYRTGRKYKFEKVTKSGLTDIKRNPQIIVSLTSFPDRIPFIYKTISSLLNQTLKPDMVILWLAKEQFPQLENNLPDELLELKKYGLTIKWCNNIRSYKKLVPAIKEYPNDIIITVDDDIYYDKTLIELLYKSYEKEPEYIHCHRCTKIFYKNGKIKAKGGGKKFYKYPSYANKLVGVGGVLYPPNSLYCDITNENLFMELAPTNDDIWFWLMAVLNNKKIKVIKNNIPEPAEIDETMQGPCLTQINDHGDNLFYKQLDNILNHYEGLEDKIKSDM